MMPWNDYFPPINLWSFPMQFSKEKIKADRQKAIDNNQTVTVNPVHDMGTEGLVSSAYVHGQVFPKPGEWIPIKTKGKITKEIQQEINKTLEYGTAITKQPDTFQESIRSTVLNEANKIVNGARNKQYGSPEDNFQNIADLWNGYLGTNIKPVDVANLMALMKIARLKYSPDHRDSWVDLAGYAACGAEIGLK